VEVGGQLLVALAHHGRPMPLKDLAALADMPPAKAHPYVTSFVHIGLMEQDAQGHYGLGALALQLGLISLQQYDPVRLATPVIDALAHDTGHTAAIAVWGNRGATIVRVAEPTALVHVAMRHGTVLNVADTATGSLFAAYLEAPVLAATALDDAERALLAGPAFAQRLDEIRRRGLARAVDQAVRGAKALAAPLFDDRGRMVVALTLIGLSPDFDAAWNGRLATRLRDEAVELSRRLGAPVRASG
jgi:DNA-binding IclR family transcriptional regulator